MFKIFTCIYIKQKDNYMLIEPGKKITFMEVNELTEDLFLLYKSHIYTVKIDGFSEFLSLYDPKYDGKKAEIKSYPFIDKNGNWYCTIYIDNEFRNVFCEFVKHFTNTKNSVILDENLFKL